MSAPLCEQLSDIRQRMHEIAKEEGRTDTDVMTATEGDLDALAARYDLERQTFDTDDMLRLRIMAAYERRWK